jgi:hypothetical protein
MQMAAAIERQIAAVRELPGFATAKALVVCENNSYMIADELRDLLRTVNCVANMDFLHLTPLVRIRSGGAAIVDSDGSWNPGLVMRPAIKTEIMLDMVQMFAQSRVHLHSHLVTYASKDEDFQRSAGLAVHLATGATTERQLDEGVAKARDARIRSQTFKQFSQMMRVRHARTNRVGETIVTFSFSGKKGKDEETGLPNKDDIVMATGILVYAAKQVYRQPLFQAEYGTYAHAT